MKSIQAGKTEFNASYFIREGYKCEDKTFSGNELELRGKRRICIENVLEVY